MLIFNVLELADLFKIQSRQLKKFKKTNDSHLDRRAHV